VDVARYVAHYVAPDGGETVLDVGAGTGKFCLVAAHARRSSSFVGVEQREQLVAVATDLAAVWRLPNAEFVHGDAFSIDWGRFDGFYFFNPFAERLFGGAFMIDRTIDVGRAEFDGCIDATLDRLAVARLGTRVVTYHGLGAALPSSYDLASLAIVGSDRVEVWQQTRSRITRPYRRVEVDE
jgi:SAM-dependent methyltransferase